jgi:hypothetical protein
MCAFSLDARVLPLDHMAIRGIRGACDAASATCADAHTHGVQITEYLAYPPPPPSTSTYVHLPGSGQMFKLFMQCVIVCVWGGGEGCERGTFRLGNPHIEMLYVILPRENYLCTVLIFSQISEKGSVCLHIIP